MADHGTKQKAEAVADHYSSRANQSHAERMRSPIVHLRLLNNWVRPPTHCPAAASTVHAVCPCATHPNPDLKPTPGLLLGRPSARSTASDTLPETVGCSLTSVPLSRSVRTLFRWSGVRRRERRRFSR